MKRKCLCIIALMSVVILVISSVVVAETENESTEKVKVEETQGQTIYIDPTDLIDELTLEELENSPYLKRAYEAEESLHDVIFHCADGNEVAYFFQYPVKYVDKNGNMKDISTSITANQSEKETEYLQLGIKNVDLSTYEYASKENTFTVYYDKAINDETGTIIAAKGQYAIALNPIIECNTVPYTVEDSKLVPNKKNNETNGNNEYESIEYNGVFGVGTSLVYNTTYTGYKETLKLEKNIGKNNFSFKLSTNGLFPLLQESGGILLVDKETDEVVAKIAPIFVYDSSVEKKHTLNNHYEVKRIDEYGDEYMLTLIIDSEFLNDTSVQYPIYIDPTTVFNTSTAINDAPVYSGLPNAACGANYFNCIGYVDSTYKNGSLLIKFPGLQNSTWFNSLDDSRINSVIYNAYKVGGGSISYYAEIKAYYYNGIAWNESNVTYSSANISSYTGSLITEVDMRYNTKYKFDITAAALAWKNGTKSYNKGLVLKNGTSTTNHNYERDIASVEYGVNVDSSVMPYIAVVYNSGNISGTYDWFDEPAYAFANRYFQAVAYTHIEHGAALYKLNNKYYYYNPHYGEPHSIYISHSVPYGATYYGYVKICYTQSTFTNPEMGEANANNYELFLMNIDGTMLQYEGQYSSLGTLTNVLDYSMYYLDEYEEFALANELRPIWEAHFDSNDQCLFNQGCNKYYWPHYY